MITTDRTSDGAAALERVPTGIPGLDLILGGGFFRGGVYMIQARPGAGKTILGNHICFRHAASGGRVLFVTLLTESHGRMLAQLRNMEFFDPAVVGRTLMYVAGYQTLAGEGLAGLLVLIRKTIRDQGTSLLVVDGLVTAGALAESQLEMKRFIHELQVLVDMVGCTALLLTGDDKSDQEYAQRTMADGLVFLHLDPLGMEVARSIEIEKFRGSAFLAGKHLFDITSAGIVIHPRTEALFGGKSLESSPSEARLAFGIQSLDKLVGGGLTPGSITMLLGAPGTGKTLLGLHYLSAARENEPAVYFGFFETREELARKADSTGSDLRRRIKEGLVEIVWQPPIDGVADALTAKLISAIKDRAVKRLFIDGLGGLSGSLVYPDREERFFGALFNELRALGVTTLVSEETRDLFGAEIRTSSRLVAMIDNVVFLRHVELRAQLLRLVSVVKMRQGACDSSLREFSISSRGIEVSSTFDTAEAILTGIARMSAAPRPAMTPDVSRSEPTGPQRGTGVRSGKRRRRKS